MFTPEFMPSIEYYLRGDQRRPEDYYTSSDANALWWHPNAVSSELFGSVHGASVDANVFRRLCRGDLTDGRTVARGNGFRRLGMDFHFAPPKSVSIVALLSNDHVRSIILAAHDEAVREALQFIFDQGLLKCRRGHSGAKKETPEFWVAAVFRELTSRANDPQLHSHAVIPNIALRKDGSVGALDNKEVLDLQLLMGAFYNTALASRLRAAGLDLVRRKRGFEIAGVPLTVIDAFSKRRKAIENAGKKEGVDVSRDRSAADRLSLATRPKKDKERSASHMLASWREDLHALGFDINDISLHDVAGAQPERTIADLARTALDETFEKSAVLKRSDMLAAIAESLQCSASPQELRAVLSDHLDDLVVRVGDEYDTVNKASYSTRQNVELEKELIKLAVASRGTWSTVDPELVERAIKARPSLSDEQKSAIWHGLTADGISIVEGSAGAGKSFAWGTVTSVAQEAGRTVYALAPSWAATKVIAKDTNTPNSHALAVQGFLLAIEAGRIVLSSNDIVLLDEAGMVPTRDLYRVARACSVSKSKLILSGDTRQLQPVAWGSPLRLLSRVLSSSKMREVRRQSTGWQRDASMLFAKGNASAALQAYDDRGHIFWCADGSTAIAKLADRFVADRLWDGVLSTDPAPTALAIAGWNTDVLELNAQIRVRLQEAGLLSKAQFSVPVAVTDREGKKLSTITMLLADGDRVAFTERVDHPSRRITNADSATVLKVDSESITLRFDDGQVLAANFRELVGRRVEGQPGLPCMKHIFAVTAHFSQGLTVDRAYVLGTKPMTREGIYVAMTRHRHSVQLYVDTSRTPKSRRTNRKVRAPDGSAALSQKRAYFAECDIAALKLNASDFAPDPMSWAFDTMEQERRPDAVGLTARMNARMRWQLRESAHPEPVGPRGGIPNALYQRLVGKFIEASVVRTASSKLLSWIGWLRDNLSSFVVARRPATLSQPNSEMITSYGVLDPIAGQRLTLDELDVGPTG
ncbi:hypothetical protein VW35_16470 [Devosia soli]|uniref:TrwC relaxase domain-containing protein n=1 Tax=Devosia soli TaxID=361041 RepID=A0A0F5L3W3_9HYPH|nr:MobF family relaxase [Devosia soli]KKB76904.1 hypothetical protein VW35_16470 [Devosia soli]